MRPLYVDLLVGHEKPAFMEGDIVRIDGLLTQPTASRFNTCIAYVIKPGQVSGSGSACISRWAVKVESFKQGTSTAPLTTCGKSVLLNVKIENLILLASPMRKLAEAMDYLLQIGSVESDGTHYTDALNDLERPT